MHMVYFLMPSFPKSCFFFPWVGMSSQSGSKAFSAFILEDVRFWWCCL